MPLDTRLRRFLVLAGGALLAFSCYFVYRISMVVYRIEQSLVSISKDVEQVTGTAARLAEKVDRLAEKVEHLAQRTKEALHAEEAEHAIDEMARLQELRRSNPARLDNAQREEIKYLLAAVKGSGCRFGHGQYIRSALNYYLRLYAKFKTYEDALTSAEDFIRLAASESVGGEAYYVVLGDGTHRPLADWLSQRLSERRKAAPEGTER